VRDKVNLAGRALRLWTPRHWLVALLAAAGTLALLGVATVLIPNDVFRRDVAPVAWNYPVWVVTALLTGLLVGTYVRVPGDAPDEVTSDPDERKSLVGMAGTALAWFAIGCPVCNKIALLALGYSGALTYFAPVQPWLAGLAIVLLVWALLGRLAGQVACPAPA
jgi:hypothetical protein